MFVVIFSCHGFCNNNALFKPWVWVRLSRAQQRHVTSAGTTLHHIRTAWGRACPEKLVPTEDKVVLLCTSEGIWWSEVNVSTCLYQTKVWKGVLVAGEGPGHLRSTAEVPLCMVHEPQNVLCPILIHFHVIPVKYRLRSPSVPSVWGCNPKIPRCLAAARLELTSQSIHWWMHKLPPLSPGLK